VFFFFQKSYKGAYNEAKNLGLTFFVSKAKEILAAKLVPPTKKKN
jgi:hypothetical protein